MQRTEFYESAVKSGFYGVDRSNLYGKKDNVRKYWEDVSIKMSVRPVLEEILGRKEKIRIVDLGSGSGEGVELLTHIPPSKTVKAVEKEFLMTKKDIEIYKGVDISSGMVRQGKENYAAYGQIEFIEGDLTKGFPFKDDEPYDLYFSSYASQSHLSHSELERLTEEIFRHVDDRGYMVFDVYGRYSPEWPGHWNRNSHDILSYNMAYLLAPEQRDPTKIEWFNATYWSGEELSAVIETAARKAVRKAKIISMQDRSIFVGRHMDTTLFKKEAHKARIAVNRLFDRDYRGQIDGLNINMDYLAEVRSINPDGWKRIYDYYNQWQTVINVLQALMSNDNDEVKRIIEYSANGIVDELKMLGMALQERRQVSCIGFLGERYGTASGMRFEKPGIFAWPGFGLRAWTVLCSRN